MAVVKKSQKSNELASVAGELGFFLDAGILLGKAGKKRK